MGPIVAKVINLLHVNTPLSFGNITQISFARQPEELHTKNFGAREEVQQDVSPSQQDNRNHHVELKISK